MSRKANLVVLLALLALTWAALMVAYSIRKSVGLARVARTNAQLSCLVTACTGYYQDCGLWPTSLTALVTNAQGTVYYDAKEGRELADAWGCAFRYQPPDPTGTPGFLTSLGRDGAVGGSGEDADLTLPVGGGAGLTPGTPALPATPPGPRVH